MLTEVVREVDRRFDRGIALIYVFDHVYCISLFWFLWCSLCRPFYFSYMWSFYFLNICDKFLTEICHQQTVVIACFYQHPPNSNTCAFLKPDFVCLSNLHSAFHLNIFSATCTFKINLEAWYQVALTFWNLIFGLTCFGSSRT